MGQFFLGMDQRHEISVGEQSLLNEITGCITGAVNSSHHQCVEKVGENLLVIARAEEPVVEAIQWQNAHERPFFLGVQVGRTKMTIRRNVFFFLLLLVASGTHG